MARRWESSKKGHSIDGRAIIKDETDEGLYSSQPLLEDENFDAKTLSELLRAMPEDIDDDILSCVETVETAESHLTSHQYTGEETPEEIAFWEEEEAFWTRVMNDIMGSPEVTETRMEIGPRFRDGIGEMEKYMEKNIGKIINDPLAEKNKGKEVSQR